EVQVLIPAIAAAVYANRVLDIRTLGTSWFLPVFRLAIADVVPFCLECLIIRSLLSWLALVASTYFLRMQRHPPLFHNLQSRHQTRDLSHAKGVEIPI